MKDHAARPVCDGYIVQDVVRGCNHQYILPNTYVPTYLLNSVM